MGYSHHPENHMRGKMLKDTRPNFGNGKLWPWTEALSKLPYMEPCKNDVSVKLDMSLDMSKVDTPKKDQLAIKAIAINTSEPELPTAEELEEE